MRSPTGCLTVFQGAPVGLRHQSGRLGDFTIVMMIQTQRQRGPKLLGAIALAYQQWLSARRRQRHINKPGHNSMHNIWSAVRRTVWMDGWMYEWMDVCMDVCMYGWMYVWVDGWMYGWL